MRDVFLLSELVGSIWCVEPRRLEAMASVLLRHAAGDRLSPDMIASAIAGAAGRQAGFDRAMDRGGGGESVPFYRRGSVAVVPVTGFIAKRASMVNGSSQRRGTSVEAIRAGVRAAVADKEISSVVLAVDSPGGSADGLHDLAAELHGLRGSAGNAGGKPIVAHVDGLGASAAYYIASQASKVFVTADGEAGSIGTYMVAVDSSRAAENAGERVHLIKAGDVKGAGVPGVPISAEALAHWQEGVDAIQAQFDAAVRRGRGLGEAAYAAVRGGRVFMGADAVAKGLADGVATLEQLVQRMNTQPPAARSGRAAVHTSPSHGVTAMRAKILRNAAGGVGSGDLTADGGSGVGGGVVGGVVLGGGGGGDAVDVLPVVERTEDTDAKVQEEVRKAVAGALGEENARKAQIAAIGREFAHVEGVGELVSKAMLDHEVDVGTFRASLMDAIKKAIPPAPRVEVGASGWDREKAGLSLLIAEKIGTGSMDKALAGGEAGRKTARAYGYDSSEAMQKALDEARESGLGRLRMIDIVERCAKAAGVVPASRRFRDDDSVLREASIGTTDFPNLFVSSAQRELQAAFATVQPEWEAVARVGNSRDFRPTDLVGVGMLDQLELVPEGGTLSAAIFADRKEAIRVFSYGKSFKVTRQMIINDDLGAVQELIRNWTTVALTLPGALVFGLLTKGATSTQAGGNLADGQPLFSAAHGNMLAAAALSKTTLSLARQMLRKQKGIRPAGKTDGVFLGIQPRTLLTGVELEDTAGMLVTSPTDLGQANPAIPNPPANRRLAAVSTPWITSATVFYLLADPSVAPTIQLNFLNGQRVPQFFPVGNGSPLSMEWEVIYDLGAKELNPEGGVYCFGA